MKLDERKERMLSKKNTLMANFKKFTEKYYIKDTTVVLVEGGDDPKYYRSRLTAHLDNVIEFVKCGGKEKVKELYYFLKMKNGYNDAIFLTFIDRDYDDLLDIKGIYETPCYSIENLYTSFDTLKSYLEDTLNMTEEDIELMRSIYGKLFEQYHESILELNIWMYAQRLYVNDNHTEERVNLNDKSLTMFIDFDLGNISSKYKLEDLNDIMKFEVPEDYISRAKGNIESEKWNPEARFRGKFEIKFLHMFMLEIQKHIINNGRDLPKYLPVSKRYKIKTNFSDLMYELSTYAITPPCLKTYIRSYYKNADLLNPEMIE